LALAFRLHVDGDAKPGDLGLEGLLQPVAEGVGLGHGEASRDHQVELQKGPVPRLAGLQVVDLQGLAREFPGDQGLDPGHLLWGEALVQKTPQGLPHQAEAHVEDVPRHQKGEQGVQGPKARGPGQAHPQEDPQGGEDIA
jgi:hypothetical protein